MKWFWYGIEFSWNKLLKPSILQNPMELIGYIIVGVSMAFAAKISYQELLNYRKTKRIVTLYISLAFTSIIISGIFLIIDRICLAVLGLAELGILMSTISLLFSALSLILFGRWIILSTYPEHQNIFTYLMLILIAIYVGISVYANLTGPPNLTLQNNELTYSPIINLIVYITYIPVYAMTFITLFLYANKIQKDNLPNSKRIYLLGIGSLVFWAAYIAEINPFLPSLSIVFRICFLIGALLWYISLFKPHWFKDDTVL